MANTKSAKKALRVAGRKAAFNKGTKINFREAKKAVMDFVKENQLKEAEAELSNAFKTIDKAVKKQVLHKNKGARLKSEISKAVNSAKAVKKDSKKS